jgi:hypothetical protein
MPDEPPRDPFLPVDIGAIALATMYRGLRRAGLGMIESAVLVATQVAMGQAITQAGEQKPPQD